ncbi:Acg family FMN-binding oxidoreductase [Aldersonia kunmingensis]|uniref:Acg family FMN-binding oxidoreductase n=1 Tax=Aldersonia kunmingensis TaxID=408066 RepID=UPI0008329D00|nr:nitroreductase family protein [Aldersonia kunmingensis]
MTRHTQADPGTLEQAITLATRAPSVHNTQPWRWRLVDDRIDLFADDSLMLSAADSDGRELLLSCGAALHHLRTACAAAGWATEVERMPRLFHPTHLATIRLTEHRPTSDELSLADAIVQRRTDRRPYDAHPVPPDQLQAVLAAATGTGALAREMSPIEGIYLGAAQRAAARRHAGDPDYRLELVMWSGQECTSDGVPASNCVAPQGNAPLPARVFVQGAAADDESAPMDYASLIVITTESDDPTARLRAGEAMSAAMLEATRLGLATCPVTEPLECLDIRADIRRELLDDKAYPQMVLRVGYAPAGEVEPTPRRRVADVLMSG